VQLARKLVEMGWEVVSTGGTAKVIAAEGVPVTLVETVTGFPEMLGGRLKTLHPKVHGGILAIRTNPRHMKEIAEADIYPIDLVVVNLYDFAGNPSMEQIDIGGPTMLRSAAKNAADVAVVVDPADYDGVLEDLAGDGISDMKRLLLAYKVFSHTAKYDGEIATWLGTAYNNQDSSVLFTTLPAGH